MVVVPAFTLLALTFLAAAHGDHSQARMTGPHKELWYNILPGDGGTQARITMLFKFGVIFVTVQLTIVMFV